MLVDNILAIVFNAMFNIVLILFNETFYLMKRFKKKVCWWYPEFGDI